MLIGGNGVSGWQFDKVGTGLCVINAANNLEGGFNEAQPARMQTVLVYSALLSIFIQGIFSIFRLFAAMSWYILYLRW